MQRVPHLQEQQRQTAHALALQPDKVVLPVAEAYPLTDILIRHIGAAGISDISVHHKNLAMVAVVHDHRINRSVTVEDGTADAPCLHLLHVVTRKAGNTAEIIVQEAYIHPCRRLFRQDVQHGIPHDPLPDDEILQENEPFRTAQILQHPVPASLAVGVVAGVRVPVQRKALPFQIVALPRHVRVAHAATHLLRYDIVRRSIADRKRREPLPACFQRTAQFFLGRLTAGEKVQDPTEKRKHQNRYNPCHLDHGISVFVDDDYSGNQGDEVESRRHDHIVVTEAMNEEEHPEQLCENCQAYQCKT